MCFAVWSLADLHHADVLPGISERTKNVIATGRGAEKQPTTKKPTAPPAAQRERDAGEHEQEAKRIGLSFKSGRLRD